MNPAHHNPLRRTPAPEDIDFTEIAPRPSAAAAPRAFLIAGCGPFGPAALQSMRVVMVLPGRRPAEPPPALRRERIALPSAPAEAAPEGLRTVHGAVLRDGQGRLFERRADGALRALGRVLAGAQGELYEWLPAAVEPLAQDEPPARTDAGTAAADEPVPTRPAAERPSRRLPRRDRAASEHRAGTAQPARARALLPAPGKWVQVRLGEVAALLHGQLARPERLAADYLLGGWIQVYEADGEMAPDEAAQQLFGDAAAAHRLAPWSVELARSLGIALGTHGREGELPAPSAPGRIAAGRRFFALTVAADPTAATAADAAADSLADTAAAPAALRIGVPPRLLAALPAQLSREQAVAALQQATPPHWWQRWRHRVGAAARREWQVRLAGRSLDDQLWSVAPPPHGLGDAAVRGWVQRTLRLAGYDVQRMDDEWEIFWRCRGALD